MPVPFFELIQAQHNPSWIPVVTPEWPMADGRLFVRKLSAKQRAEFYAFAGQQNLSGAAFQAAIVAFCAVDTNGERGFVDADWENLQNEPATVIERISDAADDLNILSARAREELKKNSMPAPASSGKSESPESPESA